VSDGMNLTRRGRRSREGTGKEQQGETGLRHRPRGTPVRNRYSTFVLITSNALKTELQLFGSCGNLRQLSSEWRFRSVMTLSMQPIKVLRDLGVYYLDNELTMKQFRRVVSSCFFQLRQLRQIRRSAGE